MFNFKDWFRRSKNPEVTALPEVNETAPRATDKTLGSLNNDHNDFALSLYKRLSERRDNAFFSPFSVRVVCAMACAGARGETATEMKNALRLSSEDDNNQATFVELIQRLDARGKPYRLASANALWSQDGAPLEPEFVESMVRDYAGHVNTVNFQDGGSEAARADINQWVKRQTNHQIQELIPVGGLDADTRLALVNAVYFKALWLKPFEEFGTRSELFYPEEDAPARVPLMQKTGPMRYVKATGFKAVELDYVGGDLSMLVVLPEKSTLRDFEAKLSAGLLDRELRNMSLRQVELYLPRFKFDWGDELSSQLSSLGMPLAFTRDGANFSGINGHEPPHEESLYVSSILHEARVEVNEKGTEAVAATALRARTLSRVERTDPVSVFRADRPFLFAICDKKTGAILFLGRMNEPSCSV